MHGIIPYSVRPVVRRTQAVTCFGPTDDRIIRRSVAPPTHELQFRPEGTSVIRRVTLGQSHGPQDRALTRWINVGRGAPSPFFVVVPSVLLFRSLLPSRHAPLLPQPQQKPTKTKANSQTLVRHSRHGEAPRPHLAGKWWQSLPNFHFRGTNWSSVCRIQGFRVLPLPVTGDL